MTRVCGFSKMFDEKDVLELLALLNSVQTDDPTMFADTKDLVVWGVQKKLDEDNAWVVRKAPAEEVFKGKKQPPHNYLVDILSHPPFHQLSGTNVFIRVLEVAKPNQRGVVELDNGWLFMERDDDPNEWRLALLETK